MAYGRIVLKLGDITQETADVIVNAANSSLLPGGGVCGAIHRAAGPRLAEECQALTEGCPVGQAVITKAGNLPAKCVIHAVGPDARLGMPHQADLLRQAYRHSLDLAASHGAKTIAFPSISTGIYSYPIDEAALIALNTVAHFLQTPSSIVEVRFILFSQEDLRCYEKALRDIS